MKTNAFAMASLLAAAGTATVALGQWSLPMALGSVAVDQDKNVTIDFDNAPVSQVFEWLKKAGIDFVVETTDIPKDKRLTVHIKGQSKDRAVEAIADALGMSATKKGSIYTLRSGFGGIYRMSGDGKAWNFTPQEAKKWSQEFGKDFGKDWKMELGDGKAWEAQSKAFTEAWKAKGMDDKAWQEWAKKWEKMPEGSFKWKEIDPNFKFQLKEMPDIEKLMKERAMSAQDMEKLAKAHELSSEQVEKLMKERMKEMPDMEKLMKERMKAMPDMEKLMKERMKDMPDMAKLKVKLEKLHKLIESLTPAQLEKNKSQGYLSLDDLTPQQRELLGDFGKEDGEITMQFDKNGTKVTIKRK